MEFVSKLLGLCCNGSDRLGGEQISLEGVSADNHSVGPRFRGKTHRTTNGPIVLLIVDRTVRRCVAV